MDNVKDDKFKNFYFESKLKGLPLAWYENIIRFDKTYADWDDVKSAFLDQFDKNTIRPKDVIAKLMKIKQNADEDEDIESLSIRIACLFNEYEDETMLFCVYLNFIMFLLIKIMFIFNLESFF